MCAPRLHPARINNSGSHTRVRRSNELAAASEMHPFCNDADRGPAFLRVRGAVARVRCRICTPNSARYPVRSFRSFSRPVYPYAKRSNTRFHFSPSAPLRSLRCFFPAFSKIRPTSRKRWTEEDAGRLEGKPSWRKGGKMGGKWASMEDLAEVARVGGGG